MTDNHPITPPPELVQAWINRPACKDYFSTVEEVAITSARWGADQELEACCADIHTVHGKGQADWLRSMRRPKPPSLKEQALAKLAAMERLWEAAGNEPSDIVRRALEQLGPSLSTTDD